MQSLKLYPFYHRSVMEKKDSSYISNLIYSDFHHSKFFSVKRTLDFLFIYFGPYTRLFMNN